MGIRRRSFRYFTSSVVAAAISLLTLPLTTRVLGPRDYGVLALTLAVAGVGGSLLAPGSSFVISRHWGVSSAGLRVQMVSTLVILGCGVTLVWGALATGLVLGLRDVLGFLAGVSVGGLVLTLAGLVLSVFALAAGEILTLQGRAGLFAALGVAQAVVTAATTLIALFAFDAGTLSLFIGLFGGALVAFAGSVFVTGPYLAPRYGVRWQREATRSWIFSQVLGTTQPVVERSLLTSAAGLAELGLYTHSQRYGLIVHSGAKAVSRAVWPVSLDEAREIEGDFPATRRSWSTIHVGIAAIGIGFALLGDHLIAALTNDKFTDAAVFLAPWFVLTLLQFAAKPEYATLYALGTSKLVGRLSVVVTLVALLGAVVLIPPFGTTGAVAAVLLHAVVYRAVVHVVARRYRRIPFQDGWVVFGVLLLTAAFVAKHLIGQNAVESIVAFVALEGVLLVAARRVLADAVPALLRSSRP